MSSSMKSGAIGIIIGIIVAVVFLLAYKAVKSEPESSSLKQTNGKGNPVATQPSPGSDAQVPPLPEV